MPPTEALRNPELEPLLTALKEAARRERRGVRLDPDTITALLGDEFPGVAGVGDEFGMDRGDQRVDYEYERAGTASIFMFTEPLAGWREATARPTKTKLDWAIKMARLMEGRYRACPMVTIVCDNLNTHTIAAFYEAFPPTRAQPSFGDFTFATLQSTAVG